MRESTPNLQLSRLKESTCARMTLLDNHTDLLAPLSSVRFTRFRKTQIQFQMDVYSSKLSPAVDYGAGAFLLLIGKTLFIYIKWLFVVCIINFILISAAIIISNNLIMFKYNTVCVISVYVFALIAAGI